MSIPKSADQDRGRPRPNPTGDLVISGTQFGIGTTDDLSTLTVQARAGFTLTGTVTSTDNSATVTGTGTHFLSELTAGDVIVAGGSYDSVKAVVAIASDTSLTVDQPYITGLANETNVQVTPSAVRIDDAGGAAQVCVTGNGNVGIGTTGARAQLEVFGTGSGNYYGCPVGVRVHNTQSSDAWQLVMSAQGADYQPGVLFSVVADGNEQANMMISTFDGNEEHAAVDQLVVDSGGLQLLSGFSCQVEALAANYTVEPVAHYLQADAGTSGITITLPLASDRPGRTLTIIKAAGSGDVTIAAASTDQINGASTKTISTQYEAIQLLSTGNTWLAQRLTAA